jgi:hypothetical protein
MDVHMTCPERLADNHVFAISCYFAMKLTISQLIPALAAPKRDAAKACREAALPLLPINYGISLTIIVIGYEAPLAFSTAGR